MIAADVRFYFALAIRWLPAILLVSCLTTFVGGLVAFILPPVYTATATIVVEVPDLPSQLARSTVPQNALAQVQLIREQLETDEALTAMAEQLSLAPRGREVSDELIETLRKNTKLEHIQFGSGDQIINAFTVSFSASNADRGALIANTFAAQILSDDLDKRQKRAATTLTFFQEDVSSLGQKLQTSEADLLAFRSQNIAALPESLTFRRGQIADGQGALLALQAEEASARVGRANLLARTGQSSDGHSSLDGGIVGDLKTALASQLAIYKADSPSVMSLRLRIDAMEETAPDEHGDANPLPEEVREIDRRLAEIQTQKAGLINSRSALEASLLATPGNETRLRTMELERDNIQSQYTAAVGRLAEASAGERVEMLLKGERLSLFQAALPPDHPENPQRRLIVALSALGGLALVGVVAVASELLNTRIRRPIDLKRKLSIQPLGVVPRFKVRKNQPLRIFQLHFRKIAAGPDLLSAARRSSWTI